MNTGTVRKEQVAHKADQASLDQRWRARCAKKHGASVFGIVALIAAGSETAAQRKPNILVIVADDMGYADIGVHGCKDIPTPHIDSLAKNGVRCTNGYCRGPVLQPDAGRPADRPLPAALRPRVQPRPGDRPDADVRPAAHRDDAGRPAARRPATRPAWSASGTSATPTTSSTRCSRGFDEFFGFLGGAHTYLRSGRPGRPPSSAARERGRGERST